MLSNSSGTQITKNVANSNGDDGIDIDNPATTVTENTANDNADLGIEAVRVRQTAAGTGPLERQSGPVHGCELLVVGDAWPYGERRIVNNAPGERCRLDVVGEG